MYRKKSKQKEITQLFIIYSVMIIAIISIVTVLIMMIQGYRYNSYDGRIEQGGLVQFNSRPTGATVRVDSVLLANKTPSKITLTSGSHNITIARPGYQDWQKVVDVKPGTVLWLNYARLFPSNPAVSIVSDNLKMSSLVKSNDGERSAFFADSSQPIVSYFKLNDKTVDMNSLEIPRVEFTSPEDPATDQFAVVSWSKDNNRLLVRHSFDSTTEYLVLSLNSSADTYNINNRLAIEPRKLEFSSNDNNTLYVLTTSNDLVRINTASSQVSDVLASNVADFSSFGQDLVTYSSFSDESGSRMVGYLSFGKDVVKPVNAYYQANDIALHIAQGEYYGKDYLVVNHGLTVNIYRNSLPSSDSDDTVQLKTLKTLYVEDQPQSVGFSPGENRFIYVLLANSALVYDLELNQSYKISFDGQLSAPFTWIDAYHISTNVDGKLTYADFDGLNQQTVTDGAEAMPLALSNNDKYMYFVTSDQNGSVLSRIQMMN